MEWGRDEGGEGVILGAFAHVIKEREFSIVSMLASLCQYIFSRVLWLLSMTSGRGVATTLRRL